jgi:hypothetical protein
MKLSSMRRQGVARRNVIIGTLIVLVLVALVIPGT